MGGHGDKLAGNLHVHPLHLLQVGQVLLQNGRDGDVLNFYFVFTQQEQDHVQRTVEVLGGVVLGLYDPCKMIFRFVCHIVL